MNQPTSIQMLDAAIWQELGGEKANDAEAVHTLGTLAECVGCELEYCMSLMKLPLGTVKCRPTV
jgi:hypothetical protein